ncbi:unnamed protein product [Cylicostephanus goldi]|uniref:Uncharacterized protein n=1 Tax=Cylicostephanus goldi TaxID=71465 RepID=A0A3P6SYU9_CYLGO|nr:unnamed protein product [Cylicostephanus goldi]
MSCWGCMCYTFHEKRAAVQSHDHFVGLAQFTIQMHTDMFQRKDQQLKAQQGTVENHIRRIVELEAEVTSLQVCEDRFLFSVM